MEGLMTLPRRAGHRGVDTDPVERETRTLTTAPSRPARVGALLRSLRPSASRGWGREALIFAAAYLVYQLCRTVATGAEPLAVENAHRVLGAETALGIDIEAAAQSALDGTIWLTAFSWIYLAAQPVVIPLVVVWVYRRSAPVYRILRNTLIAGWMVALPVYALFPTAPPRLAGVGMPDSVSIESGIALESDFTTLFYNPFAAVPSLHCGFAFACGLAVAAAARSRPLRIAGAALGTAGVRINCCDRQPLRHRSRRRARGHRGRASPSASRSCACRHDRRSRRCDRRAPRGASAHRASRPEVARHDPQARPRSDTSRPSTSSPAPGRPARPAGASAGSGPGSRRPNGEGAILVAETCSGCLGIGEVVR